MEHRPDAATGSVAPAGCSNWNIKDTKLKSDPQGSEGAVCIPRVRPDPK
jgi:hypothetical protein